jgi:hypothetical protein
MFYLACLEDKDQVRRFGVLVKEQRFLVDEGRPRWQVFHNPLSVLHS